MYTLYPITDTKQFLSLQIRSRRRHHSQEQKQGTIIPKEEEEDGPLPIPVCVMLLSLIWRCSCPSFLWCGAALCSLPPNFWMVVVLPLLLLWEGCCFLPLHLWWWHFFPVGWCRFLFLGGGAVLPSSVSGGTLTGPFFEWCCFLSSSWVVLLSFVLLWEGGAFLSRPHPPIASVLCSLLLLLGGGAVVFLPFWGGGAFSTLFVCGSSSSFIGVGSTRVA